MHKFYLFILTFIITNMSSAAISILPLPAQIKETGKSFQLTPEASITYNNKALKPAAFYLQEKLQPATGFDLAVKKGNTGTIQLVLAETPNNEDESYTLSITTQGITIQAASYKGIIHGISSLRQIFPHDIEFAQKVERTWILPTVDIQDKPAFEWRGLMLDPVRHFWTMDETKRLIDQMALYKMNKFHWHLIDSQAWRIEIKKYPLLTSKGAWRLVENERIDTLCEKRAIDQNLPSLHIPQDRFQMIDGKRQYGGFYTQKEIKEIVQYAAIRGIDVIPEIDMPGHNKMATTCYPWLGCKHDGTDPLCLGSDKVIKFCKDVYKEVFKLFPYNFAEIGGDEVKRSKWESCPLCQERVKKENLKDMAELQSWFTRDMEKFFNAHGKRLIGWDEILEGGVSPTATVNWWQGKHTDVVQRSTSGGNEVICCPTTYCYLDYGQDDSTIYKMYTGAIIPKDLTPEQLKLVKGIQGNIWCEFIPTEARLQFMTFPRALAIAEKGWTDESLQNWSDFENRLKEQTKRMDALHIQYRPLNAGFSPGFNHWWKMH